MNDFRVSLVVCLSSSRVEGGDGESDKWLDRWHYHDSTTVQGDDKEGHKAKGEGKEEQREETKETKTSLCYERTRRIVWPNSSMCQ